MAFQVAGIKAYYDDPYTERQLPPAEKKTLPKVPLTYKGKPFEFPLDSLFPI